MRAKRAEPKPRRFRVNQIMVLDAEQKTNAEIAEITGLSPRTVRAYRLDPTGERHRASVRKIEQKCVTCGERRSRKSTGDCSACSRKKQREERVRWTTTTIIEAMHAFHRAYGRPPTQNDFRANGGDGRFPSIKAVYREFGSWSNGVEAAGFPRPRQGGYR